jgi:hypothetical protein
MFIKMILFCKFIVYLDFIHHLHLFYFTILLLHIARVIVIFRGDYFHNKIKILFCKLILLQKFTFYQLYLVSVKEKINQPFTLLR